MCQHKNAVAYCISCQDTICIDCLRDNKSCKECYCLYNMKCDTCYKTCHSNAYVCYFCDYKCCKLCLMKQLEASINDFICPNPKCDELLTLFDTIKILGKGTWRYHKGTDKKNNYNKPLFHKYNTA